jgi:adenosylmethionine-8-amino-7-oxononanoate aminotransferase
MTQKDNTTQTSDSLWRPLTQHQTMIHNRPTRIVDAQGCHLTDEAGKQYLDGLAGLWCVNVGYSRSELIEAAHEQLQKVPYLSPVLSTDAPIALANKIQSSLGLPGHVYLTASGSEANEVAFKIARQYHNQSGQPNRYKIIGRHRAYHGNTLGALAASGQAQRKMKYGPMPAGFLHIMPPYPYRALSGETLETHGARCAQALEDTIIHEGPETVAAFIMEPIISGGGVLVPPDNYLSAVRDICNRYGVLLIFDEVVSGFGRTGATFGHTHWQTQADIFTFAKGITSGYMPLAATFAKEEVFEAFYGDQPTDHLRSINTYGGHPVAAAVGLKNIEIIESEGLIEQAARKGDALMAGLSEALANHPSVGEIRGKGLLIGIELVTNRESKTPLSNAKMTEVIAGCKQHGVLIGQNGNTIPGHTNVLILCPPLIIEETQAGQIIEVLRNVIYAVLDA